MDRIHTVVGYDESIPKTHITHFKNKYIRGAIFYNDFKYLPNTKMISTVCDKNIWKKDIEKELSYMNFTYNLKMLNYPYSIEKNKDCDTLYVNKGECYLKFLLIYK